MYSIVTLRKLFIIIIDSLVDGPSSTSTPLDHILAYLNRLKPYLEWLIPMLWGTSRFSSWSTAFSHLHCIRDSSHGSHGSWKPQFLWLGSPHNLSKLTSSPINMLGSSISPSENVRDLGISIDPSLSMKTHISHTIF